MYCSNTSSVSVCRAPSAHHATSSLTLLTAKRPDQAKAKKVLEVCEPRVQTRENPELGRTDRAVPCRDQEQGKQVVPGARLQKQRDLSHTATQCLSLALMQGFFHRFHSFRRIRHVLQAPVAPVHWSYAVRWQQRSQKGCVNLQMLQRYGHHQFILTLVA